MGNREGSRVPERPRRGVPTEEVLAAFANLPVIDPDELRADIEEFLDPESRDPFEGLD